MVGSLTFTALQLPLVPSAVDHQAGLLPDRGENAIVRSESARYSHNLRTAQTLLGSFLCQFSGLVLKFTGLALRLSGGTDKTSRVLLSP